MRSPLVLVLIAVLILAVIAVGCAPTTPSGDTQTILGNSTGVPEGSATPEASPGTSIPETTDLPTPTLGPTGTPAPMCCIIKGPGVFSIQGFVGTGFSSTCGGTPAAAVKPVVNVGLTVPAGVTAVANATTDPNTGFYQFPGPFSVNGTYTVTVLQPSAQPQCDSDGIATQHTVSIAATDLTPGGSAQTFEVNFGY